jgi:hypothetical protein
VRALRAPGACVCRGADSVSARAGLTLPEMVRPELAHMRGTNPFHRPEFRGLLLVADALDDSRPSASSSRDSIHSGRLALHFGYLSGGRAPHSAAAGATPSGTGVRGWHAGTE